jgi:hypothetical protein
MAAPDARRAFAASAALAACAVLLAVLVLQSPKQFDCGQFEPPGHDSQVADFHITAAVTLPLAFAVLVVALVLVEGRERLRSAALATFAALVVLVVAALPLVGFPFLIGGFYAFETPLGFLLVALVLAPFVLAVSGRMPQSVRLGRTAIRLALLAVLPAALAYAVWWDGGPPYC